MAQATETGSPDVISVWFFTPSIRSCKLPARGDSPSALATILGATCSHSDSPVAEHAWTFDFAASRMRASGSGSAGDNCATAGRVPARNKATNKLGRNPTNLMQFLLGGLS